MKMKLIIQDDSGHTEMEVNVAGLMEQINDHPSHWVVVDDILVAEEKIPDVDWETVNEVKLMEHVVGGC